MLRFILFALVFCPAAFAQSWTGIIDPSRAINWQGTGFTIPNRTTVCATETSSRTYSQVNTDINSCTAGDVINFSAGTYNFTGGLTLNKGVSLRATSPESVILKFTGSASCTGITPAPVICVGGAAGYQDSYASAATWTAGYSVGTTTITVGTWSGAAPTMGQVVILDQNGDSSDTGGIFTAAYPFTPEGNSWGRVCTDAQTTPFCGGFTGSRNQTEVHVVTNVSGSSITIAPPVAMPNWRSGQYPGIWFTTASYVANAGIENMTVDVSGCSGCSGIMLFNTQTSWIKNTRVLFGTRANIWVYNDYGSVIRDSYMFGNQNYATTSYGIETDIAGFELIENNIGEHMSSVMVSGNPVGAVFGYNFTIGTVYNPGVSGVNQTMISTNHDSGSLNLYEGNISNQFMSDTIHGTGNLQTSFRNRIYGQDVPTKYTATFPVYLWAYNRAQNWVGNILGNANNPIPQTNYQAAATNTTSTCPSTEPNIWILGMRGIGCGYGEGPALTDTITVSSLLRWGNYDIKTGAVRWNSSEIPTSGITYISGNAVPSSHTLPASFYLAGQPAFWVTPWGTPPYPPIGPDVTGGTDPLFASTGYNNPNPAELCWLNTTIDPNYQQSANLSAGSWAGNTASFTVSSPLPNGGSWQPITIIVSGVTPGGYNGTYQLSAATSSTIAYALGSNPGAYSSGGTVTWYNVKSFDANVCYYGATGSLTLSPPTLPNGTTGVAYSQTVTASGGTAPYTYAVTSGSLPTSLSLNTSTGVISGTPTVANTFTFTITATDSTTPTALTGHNTYTVTIGTPGAMPAPARQGFIQ